MRLGLAACFRLDMATADIDAADFARARFLAIFLPLQPALVVTCSSMLSCMLLPLQR